MCRSKAILRQRCRRVEGRDGDTVSRYSPFTTIPESTVASYHRASQDASTRPDTYIFFGYTDKKKKKRQREIFDEICVKIA